MTEIHNDTVVITDVTLREYGQNVPSDYLPIFTAEIRVEIARRLIDAGFNNIEVFSCSHPRVTPAMNKEALTSITKDLGRAEGVNIITLVPNKTGYKTFLDLDLGPDGYNHTMGIFFSAVEAHNRANVGKTIQQTIQDYMVIVKDARSRGIRVAGYVSAVFGYRDPAKRAVVKPGTGEINRYIDLLFDLGVAIVTVSDLQGVANERETGETLESVLNERKGRNISRLGYHPHHVDGEKAIANSKTAYDLGIRHFDSSLGGTGGCVTGAPGNQPTERLMESFTSRGIETGLNQTKVFTLARLAQRSLYNKIALTKKPS